MTDIEQCHQFLTKSVPAISHTRTQWHTNVLKAYDNASCTKPCSKEQYCIREDPCQTVGGSNHPANMKFCQ